MFIFFKSIKIFKFVLNISIIKYSFLFSQIIDLEMRNKEIVKI